MRILAQHDSRPLRLLALALCGLALFALLLPAAAGRPVARARAPLPEYPRYAQATSPLDHWQQRSRPVLQADQPWEHGAVQEPTVLYDGRARLYRMWYSGGWGREATGYAWSRDGVHWHKHSGPVLGLGAGGYRGCALNSSVTAHAGTYYLYFSDGCGDRALHVALSADGVHWRAWPRAILAATRAQPHLANTVVWVEGHTWHMLYESATPDGIWQMGLALGQGPLGWRRAAFGLRSLAVGAGMYGGPALRKIGAVYHLWYHAARSGTLPTDIYHATSRDLVHWRRAADGPVLARALPWEVDQTADACVVAGRGGHLLLYYSGMDNRAPRGSIGVAG